MKFELVGLISVQFLISALNHESPYRSIAKKAKHCVDYTLQVIHILLFVKNYVNARRMQDKGLKKTKKRLSIQR